MGSTSASSASSAAAVSSVPVSSSAYWPGGYTYGSPPSKTTLATSTTPVVRGGWGYGRGSNRVEVKSAKEEPEFKEPESKDKPDFKEPTHSNKFWGWKARRQVV